MLNNLILTKAQYAARYKKKAKAAVRTKVYRYYEIKKVLSKIVGVRCIDHKKNENKKSYSTLCL